MIHNYDFQDQVTKIYPNAKCFKFNDACCIMEIPDDDLKRLHNNQVFARWPKCYSRWQDNCNLAWKDAYERIQLETLTKFER